MQGVYKKIRDADIILLASPIFFGSLTSQTKAMIDRFQCAWRARYILKKDTGFKKTKGVFISVEGSKRKDFFDNAKSIVRNLFATINVDYKEELFCPGIDEKRSILKHPECLEKAFELGMRLVA
jgi:multimeric flavodoxin WrbA